MRNVRNSARATVILGFAVSLCLVVLMSCSSSPRKTADVNPERSVVDAPDHFVIGEHGGPAVSEPSGSGECRSPMVDPRDGTRIQLVRSSGGVGDYEVPTGRYGVGKGEVLRLDCGSGRALGVAPAR